MASPLTDAQTERVRKRVRLLIEITARSGAYRKGLLIAAGRLSPEEAAILQDLTEHGLQVPQMRDVLCGGHVLVDDPALYDAWAFESVSHERLSSHHKTVDKKTYPDIGMRGAVVREKLHGRTAGGTWIQLEKTPAAMGSKKLPTMTDVMHLMDYFVYKITKRNVGPWGLSGVTERRPLYLSPSLAATTDLNDAVEASLTHALHSIEQDDDTTSASSDLAHLFPPPDRPHPMHELGRSLEGLAGRGLFGNSEVWVTEAPAKVAKAVLGHAYRPPQDLPLNLPEGTA